ncbi:hypothetical protein [Cetobacterium sp.]|uniref:hypothetical protein n=1 Tax=Cetobacterium sp. TaxID=2071632 RepID=UPI003F2E6376
MDRLEQRFREWNVAYLDEYGFDCKGDVFVTMYLPELKFTVIRGSEVLFKVKGYENLLLELENHKIYRR